MATYNINLKQPINTISYNRNKQYINNAFLAGETYSVIPNNKSQNNLVYKNNVKSINKLTDNNWSKQHSIYPFVTAVNFNYNIPYLNIKTKREAGHAKNYFYTESTTKNSTNNISYFKNKYQKTDSKMIETRTFATIDFINSVALDIYLSNNIEAQSYEQDSQFIIQEENIEYFYYRSMNGTCPACVLYGLGISGGFTVPPGTDPDDENFTGGGISAGSCEDYYDQCAAASAAYGDPDGFECSVPYWTFTFNGEAPPGIDNVLGGGPVPAYIEGQGCENIPQIITDLITETQGVGQVKCAELTQANPNFLIQWNEFDTEAVISSTAPASPVGEPCSDLFARYTNVY